MYLRLILLILVSIWQLCSSESAFEDECKYHGNMCDVDPEKCLRRMKEKGILTTECSTNIYYGPGNLYETRQDTKFWITIEDDVRRDFPPGEKLTYTIYRKNVHRTNWTVPGSLKRVPGCCSLTTNDTCILPKTEPGETQYIFMPLYKQSYLYCVFELEEYPGKPKYCKVDDDYDCIELVNGTVRKRGLYLPLSTQSYQPPVDFCFFTLADDYVVIPNDTDSRSPYPSKGISVIGSGDNIIASSAQRNFSCILIKGTQNPSFTHLAAKYHQSRKGNFTCFFIRLPESSEFWLDARCEKPVPLPGQDNQLLIIILVIIIMVIIVLLIVVAAIWLYKKHLVRLTFAETIKELPNTLALDTEEGRRLDENISKEVLQSSVKEIPDAITFSPNDKDQSPQQGEIAEATSTHDQALNGDIRYTVLAFANDTQQTPSPTLESPDSGFHSGGFHKQMSHEDDNESNESANNNNKNVAEVSATSIRIKEDSGMTTTSIRSCQPQVITEVDKSLDKNTEGYMKKNSISQELPTKKLPIAEHRDNIAEEAKPSFTC